MAPGTLRSLFATAIVLAAAGRASAPADASRREATSRQLAARREALEAFRASGVASGEAGASFPWLPVGLSILVLGAAYPFAHRFFRETVDELTGKDR